MRSWFQTLANEAETEISQLQYTDRKFMRHLVTKMLMNSSLIPKKRIVLNVCRRPKIDQHSKKQAIDRIKKRYRS